MGWPAIFQGWPWPPRPPLGSSLDDGLSCTPNITAVARSCRFAPYNICRIRSFLTGDATKLLVQALVIFCLNSLLARLTSSATKPLQRIQNAAACLVDSLPKFSHVTVLLLQQASCCEPHLIKDNGAGLQGHQRNCTCLPPNTTFKHLKYPQ